MKKIKLLLITLTLILLSSCDALDNEECLLSVKDEFPNAIEIIAPVGEKYKFIVKDSDEFIYYVETMNQFDAEVSKTVLIFKKS